MALFHRPSSIVHRQCVPRIQIQFKRIMLSAERAAMVRYDMEMMPCLDMTSMPGHINPVLEIWV